MAKVTRKSKYTKPITNNRLFRILIKQAIAIRSLTKIKNQHLVEEWLRKYSDYIYDENTPLTTEELKRMGKYKAGDIIYAEFGFNVGREHGGSHYAVVIENNEMSSAMIMVVPLSSLPPDKTEADVFRLDVYLGEIPELNAISHALDGTQSVAVINQMRAISKRRIIAPKTNKQKRLYLEGTVLEKIYNEIANRYTKHGIKRTHRVKNIAETLEK
ncbi:type II toxin-antitoxin system PemK/MazF family toxin [Bacillus altitudinis]|uniref:type II toxin-antitoxin system PemK/MazF family toxin n=1 Tax=Bacillus altitudinis TaxID=293387 RepID=UPI0024A8371A|nr:type II toxin-antitoxin system PemK/MazF family toxin [Bacillus altitudinis]WHF25378.1 type II toxin-antitoxin system PemK/MazF family toxin [Bacillus altitudinis]